MPPPTRDLPPTLSASQVEGASRGSAPSTSPELQPGFYPDLPADEYHGLPFASATRLNQMAAYSPAHVKEAIDNPAEPTPAKIIGDAGHFCILEPRRFSTRYIVADQCMAPTKEGKRCSKMGTVISRHDEWFCEQHAELRRVETCLYGRRVLSQDKFDLCLRMADAVNAHPLARQILERRSDTELTAVWDDSETGARCKMRADIPCRQHRMIGDLKTTVHAGRWQFERAIFKYGYFRQAAMYLDGFEALGERYDHFCIIAVEKEPPFAVAVYRILDEVIEAGHESLRELLKVWACCVETGTWPDYSSDIQDIGLPSFGWRELERIG